MQISGIEAISCVDCAVWDAAGKALGRSVRELLGGHRDRLPIISIGGYYKDGMIDVPREPGFGIRLDRKAVEKYRVA